ncbi:SubName: Full=Probable Ras-like G protein RagC {ECO:0000313/EMBL:CCA67063.1} [Serendipita indica DSM 11827]|uniref:GTP-binding protein n=1 Tax=Serendipita indica (strain DSM 11827) TaxID=1109443 RepID=G4T6W2_SERID|nr:SubName: Full=Probable Ras-like G protein RagC {ECO:0000313/EMBL:CCA67063.1} [Serendipita indica DSM 11827]CCA67063.1 probable Ras-like G protein RagC [Serendipita indica DSM 11827]
MVVETSKKADDKVGDNYYQRILITGLRRSIIPLEIWDLPGSEDIPETDLTGYLRDVQAVDHWFNAIAQFADMLAFATEANAVHLVFHLFVHKMETLANENKQAKFSDVQRRIADELEGQNLHDSPLARSMMFHATSIYDHTIYEAFSNVITRMIPTDTLGQYENLLNSVHISCGSQYAFLFDSKACLRVSANQETHEMPTFSLSVEYLKLLTAMSGVIGTGLREGESDGTYSCQLILSESTIAYWQINKWVYWPIHFVIEFDEDDRELSLIMGLSSQVWKDLRGTIEYNVLLYRETLLQVLDLIEQHRRAASA